VLGRAHALGEPREEDCTLHLVVKGGNPYTTRHL
jgi:hypothetical protein